jgi:sterol desaturase/sphingolipid hydroxylase (fatty acid hydroxylase superfamily)
MSKRYNSFIWRHFKEYFRLPKIILTISAIMVLFATFIQMTKYREFVFFTIWILYALLYFMGYRKSLKKHKPNKKWMMAEMIHQYGSSMSLIPAYLQIPYYLSIYEPSLIYNNYVMGIYCIVMVLCFIVNHIIIYVIPQKAEEYLMETYPEYGMIKS